MTLVGFMTLLVKSLSSLVVETRSLSSMKTLVDNIPEGMNLQQFHRKSKLYIEYYFFTCSLSFTAKE
jgi:hypothetical protein